MWQLWSYYKEWWPTQQWLKHPSQVIKASQACAYDKGEQANPNHESNNKSQNHLYEHCLVLMQRKQINKSHPTIPKTCRQMETSSVVSPRSHCQTCNENKVSSTMARIKQRAIMSFRYKTTRDTKNLLCKQKKFRVLLSENPYDTL